MRLLNTQKTDLFNALSREGFNPAQFKVEDGDASFKLILPQTEYSCTITYLQSKAPTYWRLYASPGSERRKETYGFENWNDLRDGFRQWLRWLKLELQSPDPWEALKVQSLPNMAVSDDHTNSALTVPEWEKLRLGIENIRTLMLEHVRDSKEGQAVVNYQLDAAIESGKRMGRKDFLNLLIGTIASTAITISLSSEATRRVWETLKLAVSGVVHLMPVITHGIDQLR
jgi:hypothetical protein